MQQFKIGDRVRYEEPGCPELTDARAVVSFHDNEPIVKWDSNGAETLPLTDYLSDIRSCFEPLIGKDGGE